MGAIYFPSRRDPWKISRGRLHGCVVARYQVSKVAEIQWQERDRICLQLKNDIFAIQNEVDRYNASIRVGLPKEILDFPTPA